MPLTPAQLQSLKADIAADPVLSAFPMTSDGSDAIAAAYNATASPNFTVWRTDINPEDILNAVVWTEYISFTSQAERDAFRELASLSRVSLARTNIRTGFNDIFQGSNKATSRQAIAAVGKRLARRIEKLFATGTGTNGDPATMTFEGTTNFSEVHTARNL